MDPPSIIPARRCCHPLHCVCAARFCSQPVSLRSGARGRRQDRQKRQHAPHTAMTHVCGAQTMHNRPGLKTASKRSGLDPSNFLVVVIAGCAVAEPPPSRNTRAPVSPPPTVWLASILRPLFACKYCRVRGYVLGDGWVQAVLSSGSIVPQLLS